MKILAVDDDEVILALLLDALELSGFSEVAVCSGANDALAKLEAGDGSYDCILLDIQMPEMNGIDLCRRIRATPRYRSIPILMLTAMGDKDYIDQAFQAGANDYINKPFDMVELETRLRLAHKIVEDRKAVLMEGGMPGHEEFDVGEYLAASACPDGGVTVNLVDRHTIENYLGQLTKCGAFGLSIATFRISNVSEIFGTVSAANFERLLYSVARCMRTALDDDKHLCAYVSHGTFVCVAHGKKNVFDKMFCASLENSVDRSDWCRGEPRPTVRMDIGAAVRVGMFQKGKPMDLLRKALGEDIATDNLPDPTRHTSRVAA